MRGKNFLNTTIFKKLVIRTDDNTIQRRRIPGRTIKANGPRAFLVSRVSRNPVMITVTATAGKSPVSAQVTVEIPVDYVIEFY
jgi:hypothetical protein